MRGIVFFSLHSLLWVTDRNISICLNSPSQYDLMEGYNMNKCIVIFILFAISYTSLGSQSIEYSKPSSISQDLSLQTEAESLTHQINMPNSVNISNSAMTFAFIIPRSSQNSGSDILMINLTNETSTKTLTSEISVLNGLNAHQIWSKCFRDSITYAYPVSDLNGDGNRDVIINIIFGGMKSLPYSKVLAIDGLTGAEIWNVTEQLSLTITYPLDNSKKDISTDMIAHVFQIDPMNKCLNTKICTLKGSNGAKLDEKFYPRAIALEYPAGNLSKGPCQDSLIEIFKMTNNLDLFNNQIPDNLASELTAIRGGDRSTLWNMKSNSPIVALPSRDLNGDGKDDLLIYGLNLTGKNFTTNEISAVKGDKGKILWSKSFQNTLALALPAPDINGDGVGDLLFYELGSAKEPLKVMAVSSRDGNVLWKSSSWIVMPSQDLMHLFL